jgi:hypothetical protein
MSAGNVDMSAGNVDMSAGNVDMSASVATLPAPYAAMCTKYSLACTTTQNPPTMVGTYKGSGTTTDTSSATWTVGSTNTFVATISSQTGSKLAGTFELGNVSLKVNDGNINGAANDFTIYGTGSITNNSCTITAAVVIVGTASSGNVDGNLALLIISTSGSGCTSADGGTNAPAANTGALFSFTATSVTSLDGGA